MLVKEMFTLTLFEILLFNERSILSPTQRGIGSEMVKSFSFEETRKWMAF